MICSRRQSDASCHFYFNRQLTFISSMPEIKRWWQVRQMFKCYWGLTWSLVFTICYTCAMYHLPHMCHITSATRATYNLPHMCHVPSATHVLHAICHTRHVPSATHVPRTICHMCHVPSATRVPRTICHTCAVPSATHESRTICYTCHYHLPHMCHVPRAVNISCSVLQCLWDLLDAFVTLRKATISFVMPVRLSVRKEQLGSHLTDFQEV
jgi:hypothetical protein